jgi:hypothetical protein
MVRIDVAWFVKQYRNHDCGIRDKDPQYYWWIPLDRPILAACRRHPAHSDSEYCEVSAKVALVNRMYSAQLGRWKSGGQFEAEDRVAQALCNSDIDQFIQPLLGHRRLTETVLPKLLKCHDRLVRIVRRGAGNDALSFCSKYLSFHVPRVAPIFDSRASRTARRVLQGRSSFRGYKPYEKHCRRVLKLMGFLAERKIKPDVKKIDYVLYSGPST